MEDARAYVAASSYETFMCRTLNCEPGQKKGADLLLMKDLILMESGHAKPHRKSLDAHFEIVKQYIRKGMNSLLKRPLNPDERATLSPLMTQLDSAADSSALLRVVSVALEASDRFK